MPDQITITIHAETREATIALLKAELILARARVRCAEIDLAAQREKAAAIQDRLADLGDQHDFEPLVTMLCAWCGKAKDEPTHR
jgi:hypothetical protein